MKTKSLPIKPRFAVPWSAAARKLMAVCAVGTLVSALPAQTIIDVKPANPGTFVPIKQVTIDDNGTLVVQDETTPSSDIGLGSGVRARRGTPVNLVSVVVDDGGDLVTLEYFNEISDVVLQGFASPTVTGSNGVGVIYPDGTMVKLGATPASKEAFRLAVRDANENLDLVNYTFYDGISSPGTTMPPASVPDFDLIYGKGLEESDYLLVMERWGNTFFVVTPLDANGNEIAGANKLRFGHPSGPAYSVYDWNTGYTNIHYQSGQAQAFSVAKVTKFFEGTSVPAEDRVVFGFRIDNDGEADVKFFGLSSDPFENNTILPAGIGNYVWIDANGDGLQDADESGLNGVLVNLLNADGTPALNSFGEPRTTVTVNDTDGNPGYYAFAALPPGDYRVQFVLPEGYQFTAANADGAGVNGAVNSDADPSTGITDVITLAPKEINFNIDAGLTPILPASIGDYVWIDANSDGIQDPDEFGVNGVVVKLLNADGTPVLDGNGDPRTTVTADDSNGDPGYYAFTGVPHGDYKVQFVLPPGYFFTTPNADGEGLEGTVNSDADPVSGKTGVISLAQGESKTSVDAGIIAAVPGIHLEKTATPETYGAVGDVITYKFKVTNTGNAKLKNVTIIDPLITVNGGPITLEIGESDSTTFSGTYAVTAADLAAGSILNTASVTGKTPWDTTVSAEDDATVTAVIPKVPGISLVKTGVFIPGEEIPSTGCDVFGLAHEFNALVFGHFDAENGDTDGRLAVGGTATIRGGYSVGTMVKGHFIPVTSGGVIDRFIVAGDLYDGTFGVNGNIVVGGERFGPHRELTNGNLLRFVDPVTFDANGNVPADGSGTTFAELLAQMTARSAALGAMPDRGVVTKDASLPYRADFVGDDAVLNVFNVSAAEWSRTGSSINITAPEGSTVLVNIHGDSVHIENVGMEINGVSLENIVYNYVGVTHLTTVNFAHLGSVLAPKASATFVAGSIDGRAVLGGNVQTSNGFEFHNYHFVGEVCPEPEFTPAKIVYVFEVENIGELTLTDIAIDDPFVTVIGGPISLDPGEVDKLTFTAEKILTPEELAAGSFTNTATVTGTAPDGTQVGASDSDTQTFGSTSDAVDSDPGDLPGSGDAPDSGDAPSSPDSGSGSGGAPPSPGSLPESDLGAGSSGGSADDATETDAAPPVLIPTTKTKIGTTRDWTVLRGESINTSFIEVKQDKGRTKRFRTRSNTWRVRTGRLNEGRNVVRVRGIGATGASRPVRFVVVKNSIGE